MVFQNIHHLQSRCLVPRDNGVPFGAPFHIEDSSVPSGMEIDVCDYVFDEDIVTIDCGPQLPIEITSVFDEDIVTIDCGPQLPIEITSVDRREDPIDQPHQLNLLRTHILPAGFAPAIGRLEADCPTVRPRELDTYLYLQAISQCLSNYVQQVDFVLWINPPDVTRQLLEEAIRPRVDLVQNVKWGAFAEGIPVFVVIPL